MKSKGFNLAIKENLDVHKYTFVYKSSDTYNNTFQDMDEYYACNMIYILIKKYNVKNISLSYLNITFRNSF